MGSRRHEHVNAPHRWTYTRRRKGEHRPLRESLIGAAIVLVAIVLLTASVPVARGGGYAVASAYSRHSSGSTNGCDGSRLTDGALTVATFLVPCGARIRVCYHGRCVTATRRDSGPWCCGRSIDLNLGVVWALGFSSERSWGVRTVYWSRA